MARKLIVEDPRFGGRGRPAVLVTTELFLRRFGLSSLSDLPSGPAPGADDLAAFPRAGFSRDPVGGDNQAAEWTGDHGR